MRCLLREYGQLHWREGSDAWGAWLATRNVLVCLQPIVFVEVLAAMAAGAFWLLLSLGLRLCAVVRRV